MSWYTQNLLRDSLKIHEESNLESDEYNDLIVLEKKINQLHEAEILSDKELELINYFREGASIVDLESVLGKERHYISESIINICKKISFYLGGYFTNDGYVHYMTQKYNLSEEEVEKMINYMNDKFRYKLIRKNK